MDKPFRWWADAVQQEIVEGSEWEAGKICSPTMHGNGNSDTGCYPLSAEHDHTKTIYE